MSAQEITQEIKAAQKEHVAGLITFSEFMDLVTDVRKEQFGKNTD